MASRIALRPAAEIIADFPDDSVFEGGEFVVFGGRGVAEAIAEKFVALGYRTEPAEPEGEHGWIFAVAVDGMRVIFQVTDFGGGEYLLISSSGSYFTKPDPQRARLLVQLNPELARDPRFKEVRWLADDDIHKKKPGHSNPVDEDDLPALMDRSGERAKSSSRVEAKSADGGDAPWGLLRRLFGIFGRR